MAARLNEPSDVPPAHRSNQDHAYGFVRGYERNAKQRREFRAKIIESTAQFRHLASRMRALDVQLVATSKQAA